MSSSKAYPARQTYLKLMGVDFVTVPSSNHASPTGSLPFLIPAMSGAESTIIDIIPPVPSHKIQEWASKIGNTPKTEPENMSYEAYMSLLDHRIRNAWLHTLYLSSPNYNAVGRPLYIEPATTSTPVRLALAWSLQSAALEEVVKISAMPVIDVDALYRESDRAFAALSELLGDDDWFLGEAEPGLLDAAVFAYTHLLCGEVLAWPEDHERLGKGMRDGRWKNLVEHERRIFKRAYL
ncbi:MAG: hypothetical protein Q9166_001878 [cf. Caloplaca sp. 2 TL-2023]